jgi:hypothetical protein
MKSPHRILGPRSLMSVLVGLIFLSACASRDFHSKANSETDSAESFIPKLVASFGDSRSTGAFALTEAGQPLSKDAQKMLNKLVVPWFLGNVLKLHVGLDMTQRIVSSPPVNAFSGIAQYSHRTRFAALGNNPVDGVQFSIVGGGMDTIEKQFDLAEQDARVRGFSPDYIVFDFGAVDFIVKPEGYPFEAEYQRHFETLLNRNPGSRILVLTIPDIVSLLSARSQPVSVSLPLLGPLTCDKIRKALNMGTELGLNPKATREKIESLQSRRKRMNESIQRAVRSAIAATEFSGRVTVAPPYDIDASADGGSQLTFDCMHPSLKGLESIAEQTWNSAKAGGLFTR